jgi:hypothetical protein
MNAKLSMKATRGTASVTAAPTRVCPSGVVMKKEWS